MIIKYQGLTKMTKSKKTKAPDSELQLIEGKGTNKLLGDSGGRYWHIYYHGERVGRVYISLVKNEAELQPFITVEINQKSRGVGIGTLVFRTASESSNYDRVFAEMRKSNVASQIAASRAGFVPDPTYTGNQLRLVWERTNNK